MRDRHILDSGAGDIASACAYCPGGSRETAAADQWPPERLAHLYLCLGLSTYGIAGLSGIERQRVTRLLRRAGVPVRPRGAGRLRPVRRDDPPGLPQLLAELYETGRLSSRQIGAVTGLPERTVRDRLRRYGIRGRTRGRWNREDRRTVPAGTLRRLYEQLGLTAIEVGGLTGVSKDTVLRSAHALRVPVRADGVVGQPAPGARRVHQLHPARQHRRGQVHGDVGDAASVTRIPALRHQVGQLVQCADQGTLAVRHRRHPPTRACDTPGRDRWRHRRIETVHAQRGRQRGEPHHRTLARIARRLAAQGHARAVTAAMTAISAMSM
jgi:hypothetical protein